MNVVIIVRNGMLELNATEERGNASLWKPWHIAINCPEPNKRLRRNIKRQFPDEKGISQPPNKKTDYDRGKNSARRIYIMKPPEKN